LKSAESPRESFGVAREVAIAFAAFFSHDDCEETL
jgi:hypothetical protein